MGEPCRIRAASSVDVAALAAIERQCYTDPWRASAFLDLLGGDDTVGLVAETPAAGIVGYFLARAVLDEGEILNLAVRPDHQRRGLARRLLARGLEALGDRGVVTVFLEARVTNSGAIALYQGAGFNVVGRRRAYYRRPVEDALILRRVIRRR
ncbi:MAG: ribosomal protein S18-alanine N-acetyltransferase [Gemmatimonadales bacterium]